MGPEFKVIGFTNAEEWESPEKEARHISQFLSSGAINIFHIRKIQASQSYTFKLISALNENFIRQLILHSHYGLINDFKFRGYHYKSTHINNPDLQLKDIFATPALNAERGLKITRSCHTIVELDESYNSFDYSFLSPIFDSISKIGYASRFNLHDPKLHYALTKYRVIALGGVLPENFEKLFSLKFAGAALLGYLWRPNESIEQKISYILKSRENLNI